MAENGFYRAFEDRFRGTRETIDARLRVYLPFLAPLTEATTAPRALDLGCGRGEWLEVVQAQGFAAEGVDLDAGMLAACRERELAVRQADALAALAEMEDESLALVSGFHIAEHLPFETLQALVGEALRVLLPGGLLILETPNPENILVASRHFYLDPTHRHPLPPPLLAFLPEYAGFARTRILRLQEDRRLHGDVPIGVREVIGGASPDYAVVAQKHGPASQLECFDTAFEAAYGMPYENLAERFDARFAGAETTATTAHETAEQALDAARTGVETATQALDAARTGVETATTMAQQALDAAGAAQSELHSVYNSRSWRVTEPLRWGAQVAREGRRRAKSTAVRLDPVDGAIDYVSRHPRIKRLVTRIPSVERRLRRGQAASAAASVAPEAQEPAPKHKPSYTQTLWRITSPRGNSTMQNSSSAKLGNARRGMLVGLVSRAGNYAKTAPRFRRAALRVLNRAPGLNIKLRQLYLESKFGSGSRGDVWSARAASGAAASATTRAGNETAGLSSEAMSNGINAGQRTPLETYFHAYGADE
ncbi:class I SAM-dependent methyltransferase [Salinisphaera sp. RV14]|uniref:class I SAM-dependent methyltransferase n=1 Tax=Salinisphaera sp. RV14 TaxID=3454140 RepID=UPI003F8558E3